MKRTKKEKSQYRIAPSTKYLKKLSKNKIDDDEDEEDMCNSFCADSIYCPVGHKFCGPCVNKQIRKTLHLNPGKKIEFIKCLNDLCFLNLDFERIKRICSYSLIEDLFNHNKQFTSFNFKK
jgi:hypothetical protein